MVPGGLYFRICVASASSDTAALPSPTGGATASLLPAPREPGLRAANKSERRPLGSPPAASSPESSLPRRPADASISALWGTTASPARLAAASLPDSAPPVPSEPPPHRAASQRPSHAAPAPHLGANARPLSREPGSVGGRRAQSRSRPPNLRHPGSRSGRLPRAAARAGTVPFRPPHRPPSQAPSHTSNQQRRRVRRAEVGGRGAESRRQRILLARRPRPPTNVKPGEPESRELVPSPPALPRRQALRRATRNTDVPPPLPPPPLIVLPLPTGLGNPPARPQPITHLLRELDPTFARPSAEHAQTIAALTYSRARKAGEPEPA